VIHAYSRGYSSLDANAVRRVFPAADPRLAAGFADLRSLTMTVSGEQINVTGTEATVTCQISQEVTPKAGRTQKSNARTTFSLRKENGQWVITGRR
jgi:ketosteroid isomerase-like protein